MIPPRCVWYPERSLADDSLGRVQGKALDGVERLGSWTGKIGAESHGVCRFELAQALGSSALGCAMEGDAMSRYLWSVVCCVIFCVGCTDETTDNGRDAGADEPDAARANYESTVYRDADSWLCNPAMASNRCKGRADATEIAPDGTTRAVTAPERAKSVVDCFYLYPTIDLSQTAQQVADYANIEDVWHSAKRQAEVFSELCAVYAPLYHQVTIGAYLDAESRDTLLEKAYLEIEDAFRHYLSQSNDGHDLVFIGHSQGSHLLRRLLQRHFDGAENAGLRKQLALAVLLGPLGDITVPSGKLTGGTFQDIPICSAADERGCVITYSSYLESQPPGPTFGLFVGGVPSGMDTPCTNPAAVGGGRALSAGAYFPSQAKGLIEGALPDFQAEFGVDTHFAVFRDAYALECKQNDAGYSYLGVSFAPEAGDQREDPIVYDSEALQYAFVGLHNLDFELATEDLASIVHQHVK
jgi:hypothetical protein